MSEQDTAVEIVFDQAEPEQPKTEQEPAPAKAEDTAEEAKTETASEEQQPESKTFTQEDVDKIVQKRLQKLERKLERQQIEQETRARIQQEQQVQSPADDPEPKESDYENYSDFLKDLARHEARQLYRAEKQAERERAVNESRMSEEQRQQARQKELIEAGESKYDDFEDVIKADRNEYSRAAYLAMLESDIGAEMLYHLANNPEEGKRIAALPAFKQAAEIGKLEDKLSAKPKPKPSNAPDPISPVTGSKALTKSIEDMSVQEFEEYGRKRGAIWAR